MADNFIHLTIKSIKNVYFWDSDNFGFIIIEIMLFFNEHNREDN